MSTWVFALTIDFQAPDFLLNTLISSNKLLCDRMAAIKGLRTARLLIHMMVSA